MYGVRVNVDFIVRKSGGVRVFLKIGTGTGTEKFSAQNMVRNMEGVRVVSEVPSTGKGFSTLKVRVSHFLP